MASATPRATLPGLPSSLANPRTQPGTPLSLGAGIQRMSSAMSDEDAKLLKERSAASVQSDESFRLLVEQAPDAIIVLDLDTNRIVEANPSAEKLFGCALDELLKHDLREFFTPSQPDGLPVAQSFQSHVAQAVAGEAMTFERAIRNAQGQEFICEVRVNTLPWAGRNLLRTSFVDISERKAADKHLAQMESKYRGLLEAAPDAMVVVNTGGDIVLLNVQAERQFGYHRDELLGQKVRNIIPEGFVERLIADSLRPVAEALAQQIGMGIELCARRKDGSEFPIELMLSPLESAEGVLVTAAIRDISKRKAAEESLRLSERALKALSRGNEALVRAADEGRLLREMCRVIVETGGYVMASIGFAEHDEAKTVRPVAWAGQEAGYLKAARISWADTEHGLGPTGSAIRTGEPQVNRSFATSSQMVPWRAEALEHGYASSLALPLKVDSKIIGALTIYAAEADAFDGDELRLLGELADDLAYGIAALRARADGEAATQALRKSMEATITALASTVELRDPYTAGHQYNVSLLAAAIARDMKLSEHDIEGIRLAGVVHDVGKISVPAEILSKPGKLNKAEFELVKMHAQAGCDIIKGVAFPWPVAQMILQHHERLDGSGYPHGLRNDEINLGARILAVADVVEAMTARRPYREALGLDVALAEVEAGKGTRYDPVAVDAWRALFRDGRFSFPS
ncbi:MULTISPECIES: PAS domain S-box protein [unclassified Bradyrhizobium]|uniref:PAS domain S-box protein n=1 Tax=unclassified Bradyrhizobium TaxID=2631580 RepID=UPI0028EC8822|nr:MULTISPECIES: PAS domain S-box protein [unclassified Bradyrhizobium]